MASPVYPDSGSLLAEGDVEAEGSELGVGFDVARWVDDTADASGAGWTRSGRAEGVVTAVVLRSDGDEPVLPDGLGVGSSGMYWDAVDEGAVITAVAELPDSPRPSRTPRARTPVTTASAVTPKALPNVESLITVESASMSAMVLEVALIDVLPGTAGQFEAAFHEVKHAVLASPGLLSLRMTHGIENPDRFVLLIEWESVDAHLQNFRETDRFAIWRGGIGQYFAQPPLVEHFVNVEDVQ